MFGGTNPTALKPVVCPAANVGAGPGLTNAYARALPAGPVAPVGPGEPVAPVRPRRPVGPAGPRGPTGPVNPRGPRGPGSRHSRIVCRPDRTRKQRVRPLCACLLELCTTLATAGTASSSRAIAAGAASVRATPRFAKRRARDLKLDMGPPEAGFAGYRCSTHPAPRRS